MPSHHQPPGARHGMYFYDPMHLFLLLVCAVCLGDLSRLIHSGLPHCLVRLHHKVCIVSIHPLTNLIIQQVFIRHFQSQRALSALNEASDVCTSKEVRV